MGKELHLYGNIILPGGKDKYFFTIELNKKGDGISFDNTLKGHRILKQINIGRINMKNEFVKEEWDTYHFVDGKFREKIHEKWIDKGKDDVINGTIFRQVWEIPTPGWINKMLIKLNDFLWNSKDSLNSKTVIERIKRDSKKLNEFSLKINKRN